MLIVRKRVLESPNNENPKNANKVKRKVHLLHLYLSKHIVDSALIVKINSILITGVSKLTVINMSHVSLVSDFNLGMHITFLGLLTKIDTPCRN